jgi:hypothetical protein
VVSGQQPEGFTNVTRPSVGADYQDSGSGIDVSSIRLSVDGNDVTGAAQVGEAGVRYAPPVALPDGSHSVVLRAGDRAGNVVESPWSFVVDTAGPVISNTLPPDATLPADARPEVSAALADTGAGVDPKRRPPGGRQDVTAQAVVAVSGVSSPPPASSRG